VDVCRAHYEASNAKPGHQRTRGDGAARHRATAYRLATEGAASGAKRIGTGAGKGKNLFLDATRHRGPRRLRRGSQRLGHVPDYLGPLVLRL
jgi:hypothetical protein